MFLISEHEKEGWKEYESGVNTNSKSTPPGGVHVIPASIAPPRVQTAAINAAIPTFYPLFCLLLGQGHIFV